MVVGRLLVELLVRKKKLSSAVTMLSMLSCPSLQSTTVGAACTCTALVWCLTAVCMLCVLYSVCVVLQRYAWYMSLQRPASLTAIGLWEGLQYPQLCSISPAVSGMEILTSFSADADGGAGAGGMPGGMPDMGGAGGMPDMGGAGGPTVEEVD